MIANPMSVEIDRRRMLYPTLGIVNGRYKFKSGSVLSYHVVHRRRCSTNYNFAEVGRNTGLEFVIKTGKWM